MIEDRRQDALSVIKIIIRQDFQDQKVDSRVQRTRFFILE